MQKWLDDNDILTYLTHKEGKSVVAERFMRIFVCKIYKKVTAYNSKSYFGYLNKLVDKYNNTYHRSVGKKPTDANYSASTYFKVGDIVRIITYKNIFSKG